MGGGKNTFLGGEHFAENTVRWKKTLGKQFYMEKHIENKNSQGGNTLFLFMKVNFGDHQIPDG